jgi:hypothetical protein
VRAAAVTFALALVAAGCQREPQAPAPAAGTAARTGVRVPLPKGWTAQPEGDGLLVGPKGAPVLRIERAPDGTALLGAEALATQFSQALSAREVRTRALGESPQHAVAVVEIDPAPDGRGPRALVGWKRVDGAVFLCSSLPGSAPGDVDQAAHSCATLEAAR